MRTLRIGVVDQGTHKTAQYADLVVASGGEPVVLDWKGSRDPEADAVAFDGLVLCGGDDLPGSYFGEESHPAITLDDPRRDVYELAISRFAILARTPLLAVCRGAQVLNVALGGGVEQHIPDRDGAGEHADGALHALRIAPDSFLARWIDWHGGGATPSVNSFHHQAVGGLASRLRASAWTDDGVVEAIETWDTDEPRGAFCVGVQWHPERPGNSPGLGPRLFDALLAAAGAGGSPAVQRKVGTARAAGTSKDA